MALSSEAQSYTSKLTGRGNPCHSLLDFLQLSSWISRSLAEVQGKLESATVKLLGDASSASGMNPALLNEGTIAALLFHCDALTYSTGGAVRSILENKNRN